jgi:hypothetical protein
MRQVRDAKQTEQLTMSNGKILVEKPLIKDEQAVIGDY